MQGVLVETRLHSSTNGLATHLRWLEEQAAPGKREAGSQSCHAITFGGCDVVSLRFFHSYSPLLSVLSPPTAISHRQTGLMCPSPAALSRWIEAACGAGPSDAPPTTIGGADGDRPYPYLGIIYLQLTAPAMMNLTPSDSQAVGPTRQVLGMLAASHGVFADRLRGQVARLHEDSGAPSWLRPPKLMPLLGLDHVPAVLVVKSDVLDHIAMVVSLARRLQLQDFPSPQPLLRPNIAPARPDEAVISQTITLAGLQLLLGEAPAPGWSPLSALSRRWSLASDPKRRGLVKGAFRTHFRFTSSAPKDALGQLEAALQHGLPDHPALVRAAEHRVSIGYFDDMIDIGPVDDVDSAAPLSQRDIAGVIRTLAGLSDQLQEAGRLALQEAQLITVLRVGIDSYQDGWPVPSSAAALQFREACLSLRCMHFSSEPGSWMRRWREGAVRLSGSLRAAGEQLIAEVLWLLPEEPLLFAELLQHIRRLLDGLEDPPASGPGHPSPDPTVLHEVVRNLLDSRSRRGARISSSLRVSLTNEQHAGHRVSRQAFSALSAATAMRLGLSDVTLLDTADAHLQVRALRDSGAVIRLPTSQVFSPLIWLISHELAHVVLDLELEDGAVLELVKECAQLLKQAPEPPRWSMSRLLEESQQAADRDLPPASLIQQLVAIAHEILPDIVAASLYSTPRQFFSSWGLGLVAGLLGAQAQGPLEATDIVRLLLRVYFVTRLVELGGAIPPWTLELDELIATLRGEPPAQPRLRRSAVARHVACLRSDLDLDEAAWDLALRFLHQRLRTEVGLRGSLAAGDWVTRWMYLAQAVQQELLPRLATGSAWEEKVLGVYRSYLDGIQALLDEHDGARDRRPWPVVTRSPTGAHASGARPCLSDSGRPLPAPSGSVAEQFSVRYHAQTNQLLLQLSRLERQRRLVLVSEALAPVLAADTPA